MAAWGRIVAIPTGTSERSRDAATFPEEERGFKGTEAIANPMDGARG
ncbi:hypothetical protein LBMAG45_11300 [Nitrospirota bacterium]|nr:hypothetical protein LBMAG45_11300 [Nitrospirota bacterium]